ncbi:universal stress protein [Nitrincola schmidtii]|uniref:universal stress protein n=1 Tax=Nitrincola schmidtii TaxID=1730894 RepID=UPI00124D667F|nr:universal stress protein [Nitrincola schmidtii]
MYNKILMPVVLSEPNSWKRALPVALNLCKTYNASLHVLTVLPDFSMPMVGSFFPKDFSAKAHSALKEELKKFVKENITEDIKVQRIVADGSPWETIINISKEINADLIVMAAHNKRKLADYVLGPNSAHVVKHSKISVMVVR